MNEHFRQGDVLLVRVDSLPKGAKADAPSDSIVLAYGETTGHAHRIPGLDAVMYALNNEDNFLEIKQPTALTHEEHDPIALAPGFYRVVRQREYTPERIRRVSD